MPFFKFALWMMWLSSSQINHICFWNVIIFHFLFLLANILRAPIMGKAKKSYVQIILLITWMVHLINRPSILFWNKYLRWMTSKPLCPTLYGAVCIHRVYPSCMFFSAFWIFSLKYLVDDFRKRLVGRSYTGMVDRSYCTEEGVTMLKNGLEFH